MSDPTLEDETPQARAARVRQMIESAVNAEFDAGRDSVSFAGQIVVSTVGGIREALGKDAALDLLAKVWMMTEEADKPHSAAAGRRLQ